MDMYDLLGSYDSGIVLHLLSVDLGEFLVETLQLRLRLGDTGFESLQFKAT